MTKHPSDITPEIREEIREIWAAAEAAAEKRGVTSPTRMLTPNCPSWCDGPHRAGDLDFEIHEDDSLRRDHSSKGRIVEETPSPQNTRKGRRPATVCVYVALTEFLDGSLSPASVAISAEFNPELTPDQARQAARNLLAAADMAEASPTQGRVNLDAHAPQYREADEKFDPERDQ